MAETFENILKFNEQLSGTMNRVTASSNMVRSVLSSLTQQTITVKEGIDGVTITMTSLEQKSKEFESHDTLFTKEDVAMTRNMNQEVNSLTGTMDKLTAAGGKIKGWGKEMFSSLIPIKSLVPSPAAVADGIRQSLSNAMNFEQGMAKINVSAQLDKKGLGDLSSKIQKIATDNKTDITLAPAGFEKINAQVHDTDLSLSILNASMKGSKAGFADLDTVSGALTQSLSAIGKENASAQEVLDTFFAANSVGAGSFDNLVQVMPGLISGASSLGINFKEVAGTFAFMTSKGESAERASALMQSAFDALGQADIQGKLQQAGISVFDDQGNIRGMVDIFNELGSTLDGMSYEEKTAALANFGITGKDATDAFSLLTSNLNDYQAAMDGTANATGATDQQLSNSQTGLSKITDLWTQFNNIGTKIGIVVLPVINAALDVASVVISALSTVLEPIIGFLGTWNELLQSGNPVIWGITAAIAALSVALGYYYIQMNAVWIMTQLKTVWDGIQAVSTSALAAAQWALNTAFLGCPLVWIVLAIGAVVTIIAVCWNKFEGFRKVIYGVWGVIKSFGSSLFESIVEPFKQILKGLSSVGDAISSLFEGNFKEAAAHAMQGFKDIGIGMAKATPVGTIINAVSKTDFKGAYNKEKKRGEKKEEDQSQEETSVDKLPDISKLTPPTTGKPANENASQGGAFQGIAQFAAGVAVPLAMGAAGSPTTPSQYAMTDFNGGAPMEQTSNIGTTAQGQGGGGKTFQIDRVCDQIVIHVQNTDGKGADTIRQEVIKVFNEIYEI